MLKTLRKKNVAKKIFIFLALVIIPAFALWGSGSAIRNRRGTNYAGKIFDKRISFEQYRDAFYAVRNDALMKFGDNLSKMQDIIDFNKETWDRLILIHEAKKRKIQVTKEEVKERIRNYVFFQKNNKFDYKLYEQILQYAFKTSSLDFEKQTTDSVKLEKLYIEVTNDISADNEELWDAFKKENEKIKVSYIQVLPKELVGQVTVEVSEIENYYQERKEDFRKPPMINIEYLGFDFPEETIAADKDPLIQQLEEIYAETEKEKDFKKLSEKYSAVLNESGFFPLEGPVAGFGWDFNLIKIAFNLEENQISEPIETQKGYYILKLKERKDSEIPELSIIKDVVENKIKTEKAKNLAEEKISNYLSQLQETFDSNPKAFNFDSAVKKLGLEVKETPLFSYEGYIPNIGASKQFSEIAFDLIDSKKVFDMVNTPQGAYIIKINDHVKAEKEKFAEEEDQFKEKYLQKKKYDAFNNFFMKLKLESKLIDNISAQAEN